MVDENKRFVEEFANPHSWLLTAENLHEQATEMYNRRSRSSILTRTNAKREVVQQTRGIDKPVFLLGGFALENAIKAFLVYENPLWVANGRLSGNLKSHKLSVLQKRSTLIPYKNNYVRILEAFESGLGWARASAPKSAQIGKTVCALVQSFSSECHDIHNLEKTARN